MTARMLILCMLQLWWCAPYIWVVRTKQLKRFALCIWVLSVFGPSSRHCKTSSQSNTWVIPVSYLRMGMSVYRGDDRPCAVAIQVLMCL